MKANYKPHKVKSNYITGNLEIIDNFWMPQLQKYRTIRIWTPSSYNMQTRYPVIYMHDGQNLFDPTTSYAGEWEVDETIESLISELQINGFIVVGIDNSNDRLIEYLPNWHDSPNGEGEKYAKFIVETLKPYIDQKYRTITNKSHTIIGGSSMGGLISFYIGLKYPNIFGSIIAMSSSFQINSKESRISFLTSLNVNEIDLPYLYLDAGTEEKASDYLLDVIKDLDSIKYHKSKLLTVIKENDYHNEQAWKNRLPEALKWIINNLKTKCMWAYNSQIEESYHDNEWGKPLHDEQKLFELLILEGQQAGLSWKIVLEKRDQMRMAYYNFSPEKLSQLTDDEINQLFDDDRVIKNKLKIKSVINNAKCYYKLIDKHGSLDNFLWSFVNYEPVDNEVTNFKQIPTYTELSIEISSALKRFGFQFVGPTIIYSFMQAIGILNDHLVTCPSH